MLLIDGVKYEEWTPRDEEEFEKIVKEHAKEIFGNDTIYFNFKKGINTKAGIGSIPDGYVISFRNQPCWYICEVELHTHPLYAHIVPQITKFINSVKSFETQREIINALDIEISSDLFTEALFKKRIGSAEVYRFIANLISKPPILAIIIDQKTEELEEVCSSLSVDVKVVEFQTFVIEGVGLEVHAHLFEPLHKYTKQEPIKDFKASGYQDSLEIIIQNPSNIKFHHFYIPKDRRGFFPGYKIIFELETDLGIINTWVTSAPAGTKEGDPNAGTYIQANLADWYRRHSSIKVGDKVVFKTIEPMKRYRLEIVK